jgi:hypothetical protein
MFVAIFMLTANIGNRRVRVLCKPLPRLLTRCLSRRSSRRYTIGSGWFSLQRLCPSYLAR